MHLCMHRAGDSFVCNTNTTDEISLSFKHVPIDAFVHMRAGIVAPRKAHGTEVPLKNMRCKPPRSVTRLLGRQPLSPVPRLAAPALHKRRHIIHASRLRACMHTFYVWMSLFNPQLARIRSASPCSVTIDIDCVNCSSLSICFSSAHMAVNVSQRS